MAVRIITLVILSAILCSCNKQQQAPVPSPSGLYFITTEKNTENMVRVILLDKEMNQLDLIDTRASVYSKYAHGWHHKSDHAIIYSGDVGTLSYKITNERLETVETTDEYHKLGRKIRDKLYEK